MKKFDSLVENFHCIKCKGNKGIVNKISVSKLNADKIIPLNRGKYLFLTCALCGYTEVFDLVLYLNQDQREDKKVPEIQQA